MLDTSEIDWLRRCWVDVDIAAVEQRLGVTYTEPTIPQNCDSPEEFRVRSARDWIADQRHYLRCSMIVLAKRLILACLEPDADMRDMYVELVRADAAIHPRHFDLALEAAKAAAAEYTPAQRPIVRARLLAELAVEVPA